MELDKEQLSNFTKEEKLNIDEKIVLLCIENLDNPFAMLDLNDVAKDLNISNSLAYKLFRREDFPAINVGKKNQIMVLPYILWKIKRQV